ncbi:hypothetical protein [Burkholderia ubonensis]|uniref:hypothetical protein n=1 Tax=Burkholderia ubonensis TaxID=101571 RepID=UPI001E4499E4|nr:hypothetical protein [Burkholderia ubonensis]
MTGNLRAAVTGSGKEPCIVSMRQAFHPGMHSTLNSARQYVRIGGSVSWRGQFDIDRCARQ